MQVISKNKAERDGSLRVDIMDIVLHTGRISKCLKREYFERLRSGTTGI